MKIATVPCIVGVENTLVSKSLNEFLMNICHKNCLIYSLVLQCMVLNNTIRTAWTQITWQTRKLMCMGKVRHESMVPTDTYNAYKRQQRELRKLIHRHRSDLWHDYTLSQMWQAYYFVLRIHGSRRRYVYPDPVPSLPKQSPRFE